MIAAAIVAAAVVGMAAGAFAGFVFGLGLMIRNLRVLRDGLPADARVERAVLTEVIARLDRWG